MEACIVKFPDEVCANHKKCIGENKSFTTHVVRRDAVHWISF